MEICFCFTEAPCITFDGYCFPRLPYSSECPAFSRPCQPSRDNEPGGFLRFIDAPYTVNVSKSAALGYRVLDAEVANVGGVVTFLLVLPPDQRRAASLFSINSSTGEVSVSASLRDAPTQMTLGIVATDGTRTATALATINALNGVFGNGDGSSVEDSESASGGGSVTTPLFIVGAIGGVILGTILMLLLAARVRRRRRPVLNKDAMYNRAVCFHHMRFDRPLLSASDHLLECLYRFLEMPEQNPKEWDIKRFNCANLLTTQVPKGRRDSKKKTCIL